VFHWDLHTLWLIKLDVYNMLNNSVHFGSRICSAHILQPV